MLRPRAIISSIAGSPSLVAGILTKQFGRSTSSDNWCRRLLAIRLLPFHLLDLLKPAHVALASVEPGSEERAHQLGCKLRADHLRADAEDVHVVVLDALVGRVRVVADGRADAGDLARRDGGTDARAAHQHCPLRLARADRVADFPRLVRVVDSRLGLVPAEIVHFVTN